MRATRAYLAGIGSAGALALGAALVFVTASAIIAFHGWPQSGGGRAPARQVLSVPAPTSTPATHRSSAAAAHRPRHITIVRASDAIRHPAHPRRGSVTHRAGRPVARLSTPTTLTAPTSTPTAPHRRVTPVRHAAHHVSSPAPTPVAPSAPVVTPTTPTVTTPTTPTVTTPTTPTTPTTTVPTTTSPVSTPPGTSKPGGTITTTVTKTVGGVTTTVTRTANGVTKTVTGVAKTLTGLGTTLTTLTTGVGGPLG